MTLDEMCMAAARYADRYDEFEKNDDGVYEDDALHYFNVFKDAINEAYMAVSREYAMPDTREKVKVDADGRIDLLSVDPVVCTVQDVLAYDESASIPYKFRTKYELEIEGAVRGDTVILVYHYLPEKLEKLNDEPIFTDGVVDPMVYISLAVARMWKSEKKFDYSNQWMQEYYSLLRGIKNTMVSRSKRRIPRRMFR